MRRPSPRAAWTIALLVALPIAIVVGLYGFANTSAGLRLIERIVDRVSDGTVAVVGLSGHFPGDLHVLRFELRDADGAWLVATDITLRSSPAALLGRRIHVSALRAGQVLVIRAPVSAAHAASAPTFRWHVDVDSLAVPRLELGPALAGAAAILSVGGTAHLVGLEQIDAALSATRVDGPGTYSFAGRLDAARLSVALDLAEPAGGPLANVIGLPGLGALAAHLQIDGPRSAETTHFTLTAGALKATADGSIDWTSGRADFDAAASAPSMTLRPDLRWDELALQAHFHGRFAAPSANAQLHATGVEFGPMRFRSLSADARAEAGTASLSATLDGLRVPGPDPALFESRPLELKADARFVAPAWQGTFALSHPLVAVRGALAGGARPGVTFAATVPALKSFARLAPLELGGRATLNGSIARDRGQVHAEFSAAVTAIEGTDLAAHLLQPAASAHFSGSWLGSTLTIERATLDGGALHASVGGTERDGALDLHWDIGLPRLAAASPALNGTAQLRGDLKGPRDDLGGRASASMDFAAHTSRRGHVDAEVSAAGWPHRPSASVEAHGTIDGAPLELLARITRAVGGGARASIERAQWRSASASGELVIPDDAGPPRGRLALKMENLADLNQLSGERWLGSAAGNVEFRSAAGRSRAEVHIDAHDVDIADRSIGAVVIAGHIDSPTAHPSVDLHASAAQISVPPWQGSVELSAAGPPDKLSLNLSSRASTADGGAAELSAAAVADLGAESFAVSALEATLRGQTARLLSPTSLSLKNGVVLGATRLTIDGSVIEASGSLTPALDLTATVRNGSLAPLAAFYPAWQIDGVVTADLRLTGTFAAPEGSAHVHGAGLRLHGQSGRAVPATELTGSVELRAGSAALDVHVKAASAGELHLTGSIPLRADGPVSMHASGQLALATANPFLEPGGRRIRGEATINADLGGTVAAPALTGTVRVEHGDLQDFVHDAHLTDVSLSIEAADRALHLTRFLAHAGAGTIAAEGTIGVLEPSLPVALTITATNAQPLASDLLTARFDGKLALRGGAKGSLTATGSIQVERADINIPNALPRDVAVLDVRRPHAPPPEPSPWERPPVGLDVTVSAPRQVFVRGRGLDTEVGGDLHVTGTTDAPQFEGGFDLRRGALSLAGASLKFTSGRVSFNGEGVHGVLDPTLDFVAESTSDVTATLTVGGYASAPTVTLSSVPELPQDEILAHLLFGVSAKQLTPFQMLGIGIGLASISGSSYGSADPLASIQKRLGLDRLAVGGGSGTDGGAATVEAGRYVSSRVYVGAVQSTSGITKLQAQIDLSKHLKLQTAVGNGSATAQGTTPQNDPGNTVGIVYQVDY